VQGTSSRYWMGVRCDRKLPFFCQNQRYACYTLTGNGNVAISQESPSTPYSITDFAITGQGRNKRGKFCFRGSIFKGSDLIYEVEQVEQEYRAVTDSDEAIGIDIIEVDVIKTKKFSLKDHWKLYTTNGQNFICKDEFLYEENPLNYCRAVGPDWREQIWVIFNIVGCKRNINLKPFQNMALCQDHFNCEEENVLSCWF